MTVEPRLSPKYIPTVGTREGGKGATIPIKEGFVVSPEMTVESRMSLEHLHAIWGLKG